MFRGRTCGQTAEVERFLVEALHMNIAKRQVPYFSLELAVYSTTR